MSAPHDETHEMHSEVATVARAMLSAGLAVADGRRQRQLRAAHTTQQQEQETARSRPGGMVPNPAGFSRRDIQQHADTMAATPGSGEHDARLRDVVSAAVPAAAEAVLADPAWPALRASLHHIENNGGDPGTELAAAADPVGTAAAYADAEAHRDTHPVAAQAWDEALRAENIDPQRVREDAAAHRDSASTDRPGTDRDLDTGGDSSRDSFAEDYLSALDRAGVDPDTARTQLREGDTTAEHPTAAEEPAPPRTMFSDGADAARLAGLSHPRSVAEQLATRTPGGQETPAVRGRENDPIRHRDRSR